MHVRDDVRERPPALVVHRHDRRSKARGDVSHQWVAAQAVDVVDDVRACTNGGIRDGRVIRVNGEGQACGGAHRPERREQQFEFGRWVHFGGAGATRFGADIEHVSAFGLHLASKSGGRGGIATQPVAAERIRGHVDDAHEEGARAPGELPATQAEDAGTRLVSQRLRTHAR